MPEKPSVNICSWCQNINSSENIKFSTDVDQKVKDELKVVNQQVKNHTNDIRFTHGICIPHAIQMYKDYGFTDDKIKPIIKKIQTQNPPSCLVIDEKTRQEYMKGFFTPEMVKQAQQSQQAQNNQLIERFKKLSGIKA